jgi:ppGpp synthetase/RelA/SpoT-type nucleotidyltranferase
MKKTTQKLLNEYKEKRGLYEDYCLTIRNLIESLLRHKGYKYHVTSRTKDLDKLEQKIKQKEKEDKTYRQLNDVEDLAGIRVIFYVERDKKKFARELDKEISVKLQFEENIKDSGYEALHTIVTLGPKRLALSEFERFKGLKCEVQLTSILYHAWAEVEHDIFYKENEAVRKMSRENRENLKVRLWKIMNNYIKKASCELEKVVRHVEKFNGKKGQ